MPNEPTSITVELPTKEYRIANGPPEKLLIFSVLKDIDRGGPPLQFKVLDDEGNEHNIYADVSGVVRDIANQHDHEKYAACYYLTGMKSSHLDFLGINYHFAAIYSVPKRTGRWIVIPEGALAFAMPGNYILRYLDHVKKAPAPPATRPSNELKGAEGRIVHLILNGELGMVQGVVDSVGESSVSIRDGHVTQVTELADIAEVIFAN